jgi:glucokinase
MLLAGDIGGTKTRIAVFSLEDGPRAPLAEKTYISKQFPNLEALVRQFRSEFDLPVSRASFGVAGPVIEGEATITNLPWRINRNHLMEELSLADVHLMNDLESIAAAITTLESTELHTLNQGNPQPGGTIAIIAPGTGLGEAFLTWDGVKYLPHPSEGGHTDFAPINHLELDLLKYLMDETGLDHVSYELVCSGRGLPNIYNFLKESEYAREPQWLTQQLSEANDPTPVIANTALDESKSCALCTTTLDMFVSILGSESGNMAGYPASYPARFGKEYLYDRIQR